MLPWRPWVSKFSRPGTFSSVSILGSDPGPLSLRCSGGTGGILVIACSLFRPRDLMPLRGRLLLIDADACRRDERFLPVLTLVHTEGFLFMVKDLSRETEKDGT